MLISQPCKGCTDRHTNCHSGCEKYAAFRRQLDEINRKKYIENDLKNCEMELHINMQGGKSHRKRNHKGAY